MNAKVSVVTSGFRLLACIVIFRQQDFIVPLQVWLNVVAALFAIPEVIVLVHAIYGHWRIRRSDVSHL